MDLERFLEILLFFGVIVAIALVIVGIPAAMLKALAATLGAPNRKGLVLRSILWGALVGISVIAIQMTVQQYALRTPDLRGTIIAFGGLQWTAIGFAVLAAMAVAVDYWMVVRPLQPRLKVLHVASFLAFSNLWVLEGGWLLASYNQLTLFDRCFDPVNKRIVDTFYEPRPDICDELSD